MEVDALLLSRLQAAALTASHIAFPGFTVGLAAYLAVLEGLWLGSGNRVFETLYAFWLRIFAVSLGMCVVTLAGLGCEIAANWSLLSATLAPMTAPRQASALLTAAFLETGLLAIMLSGWRKMDPRLHLAATVLAAIGALLLSFWLVSAAGWRAAILSPGFPSRFAHLALASYLTTALVVGAASAWRVVRDPEEVESSTALRMGVGLVAIAAPLQLVTGGGWDGGDAAILEASRAYQVMVGLGVAMIGLGAWGAWLSWRNSLERTRTYLIAAMAMAPSGFVCLVAGWAVTERGRQAFAVHDLWRAPCGTASAMAPLALLGVLALHGLVLGLGALYVLRLIGQGPVSGQPPDAARP
ncbi:cytochrome ubiquinol oxidase subunit I [Phenylobacterium sp.]|uniref:cytochrome ubiquinol oxidase subunit I n=1 Tax=Phenylobacterium sp. TaxID=1871053 RepID=UPI00271CC77F|nr:cytochrome ubiquinol oxidase subunit I [Phenylobacterium sp.]MDO8377805.1 cytochrome ubiquinol oxidase subunit I [Phenylobacterium sp.]